jgi:hypothetical protein
MPTSSSHTCTGTTFKGSRSSRRPSSRATRFAFTGRTRANSRVRAVLEGQMTDPNFPVPLSIMRSALSFHAITAGGRRRTRPDVRVVHDPAQSPRGAVWASASNTPAAAFVYATDTEHDASGCDARRRILVELARDADALVYDAMYTDEPSISAGRSAGVTRPTRRPCGWPGQPGCAGCISSITIRPTTTTTSTIASPSARADAGDDPALDVEMAREGERVVIRGQRHLTVARRGVGRISSGR